MSVTILSFVFTCICFSLSLAKIMLARLLIGKKVDDSQIFEMYYHYNFAKQCPLSIFR